MKRPKKFKKYLSFLGFLLLIPSIILNIFLFQKKSSDSGILVIAVIDGDTLVLDGKVRLRLRHVDAPELNYCGGQQSKEFLENLVLNKKIIIQEKILDQYGRDMSLAYVGNKLINEEILKVGWGRYHGDTSSQKPALRTAFESARVNKIGIFGPDCYQTENLENPDCLIKGNMANKNPRDKKYYFPGCSQYQFTIIEKDIGEQWFCTEKEAQEAGYIRSKACPKEPY